MKDLLAGMAVSLQPLLMAALTAAVAMAVRWIQTKTKNDNIKALEGRLAESVVTIVKSVSQTTVDGLRIAKKDGTITAEERAKVKADAIGEIKGYWGDKGVMEIKKVLGYADDAELDKALAHDVEEAVFNMKLEKAAVNVTAKVTT